MIEAIWILRDLVSALDPTNFLSDGQGKLNDAQCPVPVSPHHADLRYHIGNERDAGPRTS